MKNSWELRTLHESLGKLLDLDVTGPEASSVHKVRRLVASLALDAEVAENAAYRLEREKKEEAQAGDQALVNGLPAHEEVNGFIIERGEGGL